MFIANGDLSVTETAKCLCATWTVQSWKDISQIPSKECILSPSFEMIGKEWNLSIYPNGYSKSCYGFVSVFLHLRCAQKFIPVAVKIQLYLKSAEIQSNTRVLSLEFDAMQKNWGYIDFISRRLLEKKFVQNDNFTVQLTMHHEKIYCDEPILPLYRVLFKNAPKGDVLIKCKDGRSIRADSFVLKHNSYFASTLSRVTQSFLSVSEQDAISKIEELDPSLARSDSNLSVTSLITESFCSPELKSGILFIIEDLSSFAHSTVMHAIEYLYTGITDLPAEMELRCDLLRLALLLEIPQLSTLLEKEIVKLDFKPEKILRVLACCGHDPSPFRDVALSFFRQNRVDVKLCSGFQEDLKHLVCQDRVDFELLMAMI